MPSLQRARYRYLLEHEVDGMEVEALNSGLEDERGFDLAALVGAEPLAEQLAAGMIQVDVARPERFDSFATCLEILSIYMSEYISGVEVAEDLDATGRRRGVRCWRYVARRGEVIKVPLHWALDLERQVVPGGEDLDALRVMWPTLPQWARNSYKLTYDELADLDSGG
jgi:hypothetical protein